MALQDDDLYIIGEEGDDSGIVKLGRSKNVKTRRGTLQTGNYRRLVVLHTEPGAGHLEDPLHDYFAQFCVGGEWYNLSTAGDDPVAAVVRAVKDLTPPVIYTQGELDRALAEARKQARAEAAGPIRQQERDLVTRERDQYWQRQLAASRTQHQQELDKLRAQYAQRECHQADKYAAQQAEWADRIARLQGDMAKLADSLAPPRFQELASYAQKQVTAHSGEIAPGLTDYILGSTKKELTASVTRAIKLTEHLNEAQKAATTQPSETHGGLGNEDTSLFTDLVQQAFVPKMPMRRVVTEQAA
jgi:hypothetical protein